MKYSLPLLFLLQNTVRVLSADCTVDFCENTISDTILQKWKINVPEDTTLEECAGCTVTFEITYQGEAWMAFGVSPDGKMVGGQAVAGLPGILDPPVKLSLNGYSQDLLVPSDAQTLTDASLVVGDGQSVLKFTKIMKEEGEIEISPTGENIFIWSHGDTIEPGYHGNNRGSFTLVLSATDGGTPTPAPVMGGGSGSEMPTMGGDGSKMPTMGGDGSEMPTMGGDGSKMPTMGGDGSEVPTMGDEGSTKSPTAAGTTPKPTEMPNGGVAKSSCVMSSVILGTLIYALLGM